MSLALSTAIDSPLYGRLSTTAAPCAAMPSGPQVVDSALNSGTPDRKYLPHLIHHRSASSQPAQFTHSKTPSTVLRAVLARSTLLIGLAFGIYRLTSLLRPSSTPGAQLGIILFPVAVLLGWRLFNRGVLQFFQRNTARSILIVGADQVGHDVRDYLVSLPSSNYRFRGFVTRNDGTDDHLPASSEVVGSIANVLSIARSMFVDEIIFSGRPSSEIMGNFLDLAQSTGIDVRFIPNISETLRCSDRVKYLGRLPTVFLHQPKRRPLSLLIKRAIDILIAGPALLLLTPIFLVVALAIKLQSRGSIFYASERVGVKGRTFTCYKFRTMVPNAESLRLQMAHLNEREGVLFKIANDPRVTRIGAYLRKYSADELPQLWNIFRGDMSLVGPRPCIKSEVAHYKTPHFRRLDVVPGLTGLWQVEARSDPSFESYIHLDSKYVSEWSLWLDLKIIFRTLGVVVLGTGV
jgi:exopolysaccharide biosynthesis polyprenyl glycosylphosphotransferase